MPTWFLKIKLDIFTEKLCTSLVTTNNNIYNNEWEKNLLNEIIIHTQNCIVMWYLLIINKLNFTIYHIETIYNQTPKNKETNYPHVIHPTKLLHISNGWCKIKTWLGDSLLTF
jgi:hypothetical protein